jgi:cytochrome c-type biogenesis protein CcmH/NrfG
LDLSDSLPPAAGALAAWEKLAKVDPAFATRANLSEKIAQARQQAAASR